MSDSSVQSDQPSGSNYKRKLRIIMNIISTPNAPAAIGPYSQAYSVNGLLFTSGQVALDPASGEVVGTDI